MQRIQLFESMTLVGNESFMLNFAQLRTELARCIRGQDESITRLVEAVARREVDAVPQRGPRGCFLFAGPTGVGKTETARILSDVLFGPNRLLRIDCSEFKTLESQRILLGEGAGDVGRLGRAYAESPKGVWLWDEIEKGHRELVQLFLQMADASRVTLANGQTLDLREIYLVVTTNLGSAEIIGRQHLTFTSLERHVVAALEQFFRPELLGRFGKPFVFRPLSREVQQSIAGQRLRDMIEWQTRKGRQLEVHPDVLPFLVHRGFSARYGARPLLAFIDEAVGNAVIRSLEGGGDGGGKLVVRGARLKIEP